MDESRRDVEREEAHRPHHQQNDEEYEKHRSSFRLFYKHSKGHKRPSLAKRAAVCLNIQMGPLKVSRCTMLLLMPWMIVLAQAPTGEIAGRVYDPSGGAVPNATISVRSAATSFDRALRSNESGQYSVASLMAGSYEMRVEAPGFRTTVINAVVATGAVTTVDLHLQVGEQRETITVDTMAPQIEVERHSVDQVISRKEIQE
ncbi:MAG TPA: carboxypeptidase-like regulatory domain-containing protein, partial [Candidatus Acidoferrum sp.]|nr:carboxypeptidase-like regulatory domain-containing protein [Candidatus Acidoferrum sp.]